MSKLLNLKKKIYIYIIRHRIWYLNFMDQPICFFHAGAGADTDTDCYKLRGPRTDICAVELFLSTKVVVLH